MPKWSLPPVYRKEAGLVPFSQTVGYQISTHNIPEQWATTQGEGIKIAVLDTGCQINHVDITESIGQKHNFSQESDIAAYKERARSRRDWRRYQNKVRADVTDRDGHGTHVTGIITANNNNLGVVGVAPACEVEVIKVLNDQGVGYTDDIALGIEFAILWKVDVISMSFGGSESDGALHSAIKKAYAKNIPVICAAGNSGDINTLDYPAKYPETISVGALTKENIRAAFSQTGPRLDFMAPGVDIVSTTPLNKYTPMSGTSMATPWVAGVIALMIAKHRKYGGRTPVNNVEDVREHLKKTSIDLDVAGRDPQTGFGLVDVQKLLDEGDEPKPLTLEERVELLELQMEQIRKLV